MCSDNELEFESPLNQPTPHPPNGKIHKNLPTSTPADTAAAVKKQKTTDISPGQVGQPKHRIRVGDFDKLTKSLTEDCIAIYRAKIVATQPFPVKANNLQAVQLAWVEVCNNCDLQIDMEYAVFKAVCKFYMVDSY